MWLTLLSTWIWEIVLEDVGGLNIITKVLIREKGRQRAWAREGEQRAERKLGAERREIWRCCDAGFKEGGRSHKPRNTDPLQRLQGADSPLEPAGRIQYCQCLNFSPMRPFWTSDFQNFRTISFCLNHPICSDLQHR